MTETAGIELSRIQSLLLDTLKIPPSQDWYVGFSGGMDSTVLLHLLWHITRRTGTSLTALHADHGLNPRSAAWLDFCLQQCREWGIECLTTKLEYPSESRLGPEGRARDARYRWFLEQVGTDGWLFTAHHMDDQAETVIERLMRGSGARGLRGMRPVSRVYGLNLVRPLLDTPRQALEHYARRHCSSWVRDESNADTAYTRNHVRARIMPVLKERWPDAARSVARTASLMADSQSILDQTAARDLDQLGLQSVRGEPSIDLQALGALDPARQRNVLRFWIHRETGVSLGLDRLNRVLENARQYPENKGGLSWPPVNLRLYRGRLYLQKRYDTPAGVTTWDLDSPLTVCDGVVLSARRTVGKGLAQQSLSQGVKVRFRRGGEKCRLPGRSYRHTLKHVLQDARVPPWQRSRIPLLQVGEEIAVVVGLIYCDPYAARKNQAGWEIDVTYY